MSEATTKASKAGDTVYNIHGRQAEYVAFVHDEHIVLPYYEHDHGDGDVEHRRGDPEAWDEVFIIPPTELLHAEVKAVEETLTKRRDELYEAEGKLHQINREVEAARRAIAAHPDLHGLDLWMQGKVTHIVTLSDWDYKVGTKDDVLAKPDRSIRLLALNGSPKDNRYETSWAAYSDGSGSNQRCLLATSMQHAVELIEQHLNQQRRRNGQDSKNLNLARSAASFGISLTDVEATEIAKEDADRLKIRSAQVGKDFDRLTKQMDELRAEAVTLGVTT